MNKQYQDLFQLVARNGALNAEQAMKNIEASDMEEKTKNINILTEARDAFNALEDKISKNEELDIKDYIQLYAGATVSRNIIQKNINTWSAVVKEYDENLIPKLEEVAKEMNSDKRQALIDDFFGAE